MSQATIPPSPELWNNIEAQVAGSDKRRGFGFWLLLLALLLGSIGMLWGFWNYTSGIDQKQQMAEVQVESPAPLLEPIAETETDMEKGSGLKLENSTSSMLEEKTSKIATPSSSNTNVENPKHTNPSNPTIATNSSASEDPSVYRSKALDTELNEELIHTVPQHANTAQPQAQGLSEPSSVSLSKEIEEDNGMELKITHIKPLADAPEILREPLGYPSTLQSLKQARMKRWAFLGYADFHKGYRDINLASSLAQEDRLLGPSGADATVGYQYDGLNAPGNLQVVLPEESISLGIMAELMLSKRLSLQGGFEYGLFSIGTYNLNIVDNSSALPASRFNSPLSSRNTQFRYHQMGIPLQLNYKILARSRSSLEVYGGAAVYAARAYSKSITQSANFYDFTASNTTTEFSVSNSISSDVPGLIQYHPFHLTYQGRIQFLSSFIRQAFDLLRTADKIPGNACI